MDEQKEQTEQKRILNTGLISLEIVAKFNQIDIDMRSVVRNYGIESADVSPEEIIRIAQHSGFKIKKKKFGLKDLTQKYPLPAIARQKDDTYIVVLAVKLDEGKAISPGVDKKTLVEKSILKDEIFSQHEELYYVVISVEISGVLHSYLDLMEENSDMPKIYFYYDDDWSFDEYDDDGNEIINVINVSTVEELKCSLTILTIQNGVCVGCPERTEEMEHTEIYDNKIREIYREYLESKKNS